MISDATFMGGVQMPPSGEPILLMADRQTTGGYPQLAMVITADLPLAAQLAPGDWIEFEVCREPRRLPRWSRPKGRSSPSADSIAPQAGVPLAPLTTLGVGGPARWFVRAASVDEAAAAIRWSGDKRVPLFVLGGGSNLVVADAGFDGLVLQVAFGGLDFRAAADDDGGARGRGRALGRRGGRRGGARAGRPRMPVGHSRHRRRHADSERRRLRPGGVPHHRSRDGARSNDRHDDRTLTGAECGFGYRTSRFKRRMPGGSSSAT